MRVISGVARGAKLDTVNSDAVRPTTDKVKEAVFSIIQFEIHGKSFLDLFGGTGQMGIEAASRGAEKTVIVDAQKHSINVIKKNLQKVKLENCITVVHNDALNYVDSTTCKFDICFLDPPYGSTVLNKVLLKLPGILKGSSIIITETPKGEDVIKRIESFDLYKQYNYGKICINVYKNLELLEGEI